MNVVTNGNKQFLEKPLPNVVEAEKAVLGAILIDNSLMPQVVELLQKRPVMYSPLYRKVYEAMVKLFNEGKPIDPILIGQELKKDGQLDNLGGIAAITNLTFGLPRLYNLEAYCKLILDKYYAREVLKLCGATTSRILEEDEQPEIVLNDHEQQLFEIRKAQTPHLDTSLKQLLYDRRQYKEAVARGEKVEGLMKTKFEYWDMLTGGLMDTDLIILAGRPGAGKTSCALDIARNVCLDDEKRVVLIFSMEMSKEQIIDKLVCGEALIDTTRFRDNKLCGDEKMKYDEAISNIENYRIIIDDRPNLTTMEINAKALRVLAEEKRLDLIIVDHLGKTKAVERRGMSRVNEIGQMTNDYKGIAKRLNLPLILLSQLSRGVESRNPPIPVLSDLRDSGNIEEDADQVFFIYRDEYYTKEKSKEPGVARIICAKNKSGSDGQFRLAFIKHAASFRNFAPLR